MIKSAKFVVVEFSHIRACEACDVREFTDRDRAFEYINKLTAEFRPAQLHFDNQFGQEICIAYPNPYKFDQKKAARLWEDKNPAWRDAMGRF